MFVYNFISTQLLQGLLEEFHSRRLLLMHAPSFPTPTTANPGNRDNSSDASTRINGFDASIVLVLSVLVCALILCLGLNSIIRCALSCSSLVASDTPAQSANSGIKRKAFKSFPTVNYSADLNLPGLDSECVICLSDFKHGDRVLILPICNHRFHVGCIDKWLSSHSSCPKCRHCLDETCGKIVDRSHRASSLRLPPAQETVVTIAPVESEGLIHDYR
ncbi:RING-H2 finger protein ATL78 [Hibiscus syriacus]|uniref:RING-type E3 ubiquitin transferase n=1 Tax=Hibiscus syriacus TaxID=106335 RepID=A0A6A3AAY0_HIBSY|nr:RING-H2 finger protein ATL78-like [Hibiscus syriacus]KAE8700109.1 RING-H2 finger protein ATL78 [Hibiscus syriacus]